MIPAIIISKIGCILVKSVMPNAATHRHMLLSMSGVVDPKLASFISSSAAEAISPITTGRNPLNTPLSAMLSRCFDI